MTNHSNSGTKAAEIIKFITALSGMDSHHIGHLAYDSSVLGAVEVQESTAIDLVTLAIIRQSPKHPNGEFLLVDNGGNLLLVDTKKYVEALMIRCAGYSAFHDNGDAKKHYAIRSEMFGVLMSTTYSLDTETEDQNHKFDFFPKG